MKWGVVLGGILILLGLIPSSLNVVRTDSHLLQILGIVNIVVPYLSGRKIARYLHDFSLAKEKGYRASPMAFVYIWLIFWLLFLILYTIFSLMLSYTFKFLLLQFGGTVSGVISSILLLAGAYILTSSLSSGKGFLTTWGKNMERMNSRIERGKKDLLEKTVGKYL